MYDDYMPEIFSLKSRADYLEYEVALLKLRPVEREGTPPAVPLIRYVPPSTGTSRKDGSAEGNSSDEEEKLADLTALFNNQYRSVNKRLGRIDDVLRGLLNNGGVCVTWCYTLTFRVSICTHTVRIESWTWLVTSNYALLATPSNQWWR